MSGSPSMFLRDALIRQAFRQESLITTVWVALTRRVPELNAPGSSLDEPVGLNYARVEYPLGQANWGLTGYNEVFNNFDIPFPAPAGYWGQISGYALVSAATAGDTLAVGSIQNPLRTDFGSAPKVKAGGLVIGLFD